MGNNPYDSPREIRGYEMSLPVEYNAADLQRELDFLQQQLSRMEQFLRMQPLAAAPVNPEEGWLAVSDGTGSGFDGSSGAGAYRYSGSAWVFLG